MLKIFYGHNKNPPTPSNILNIRSLTSKSPCILLKKNINFDKNETESKMCRKLKIKLWWVGAHARKKKGIFWSVYFVWKKFFFNICVLSHRIVYWIYFQNIRTFTYQKTLLDILFWLFWKSSKAFIVPSSLAQEYTSYRNSQGWYTLTYT